MSIEEQIVQTLSSLVTFAGKKPFPGFAPAGTAAPFVVYQQFSGTRIQSLNGDCALANPRYQIDLYADSAKQRAQLAKQIRQALHSMTEVDTVFLNESQSYEFETRLYRQRMDFSFWFEE